MKILTRYTTVRSTTPVPFNATAVMHGCDDGKLVLGAGTGGSGVNGVVVPVEATQVRCLLTFNCTLTEPAIHMGKGLS